MCGDKVSVVQETGNRMTEQNLGLIMGPNILHKEVGLVDGCTTIYCMLHCLFLELTNLAGLCVVCVSVCVCVCV